MNINKPLSGRGFALPFTKAANPSASLYDEDLRMPFIHRIPDAWRNHFVASTGEFVGTFLFLFFALSATQVANTIHTSSGQTVAQTGANPQQLQYIALAFGFSLAVNAWVFFRISGGLFNPAVTVGMCLIGALPWFRGVLLFISQILGGLASAAIVSCLFPGPLQCQTELGGGTSVAQGLFIEVFLTAQLVFTIFMLAAEKHKGTFIAPVGIGLALFIAELTGVYFTGGSLNPARSFGPAVVNHNFHGYHWIYWVGPLLGSLLAAGFYKFIKILEYETANPGQDLDHAAKIEKTKALLIAAGINEVDASHVASELNQTHPGARKTNGTSSSAGTDGVENNEAMYGTGFRSSNEATNRQPHLRPGMTTNGSQPGKYSYLGQAGARRSDSNSAAAQEPRVNSPAMTTNDQLYAPLAAGNNDMALGGGIAGNNNNEKPAFARTLSSGV